MPKRVWWPYWGAGLMYFPEPLVAPYVKDGRLRLVLTEWSPLEEGFHIYYSSRRQLPTGLRLLIEFIQEAAAVVK